MRISDWSSDVFSSDLWKIILPLSLPGLISAGIFAFTLSWNEFIYALAFISSSENKTVPVGVLTELVEGDVYHWGSLMAAGPGSALVRGRDRKSVVSGKRVSVRVDLGGCSIIKKRRRRIFNHTNRKHQEA